MLGMYSKRTNTPEDTTQEKRCKSVFGGGLTDSTDTEGGAGDNHGPVDMQTAPSRTKTFCRIYAKHHADDCSTSPTPCDPSAV